MSPEERIIHCVIRAVKSGGGKIVVRNRLQFAITTAALERLGAEHPETYRADRTEVVIESSVDLPGFVDRTD